MSITTLKLFETLLTKPNEQIINNLVLRNLLGRSYVTVETIDSGHHSPTPDEQGHHHDNHNNADSLHSNSNNPSQGQSQGRLGEGEADETSKTTSEQENPSQTSSSSKVKDVESSQNVVSTDQNQRDSREQEEQEQKTSSELLTNSATNTTASSEDKSSPSSPSDKTSDDNGESQNKTAEPGKDNTKGSEQSVKGDGDIQRRRHHSDFESELDEILERVSSSGEGDATGDTGADFSSQVKSSSQTGTAEEEAQLVSRYGKVQFIQ